MNHYNPIPNIKSNSFIYITAILLIAHLISCFLSIPTNLVHCWRILLYWYRNRKYKRRPNDSTHITNAPFAPPTNMYEFRSFELQICDYKSYSKTSQGRGINFIPKARSGHRVAANETDLFAFGGKRSTTISISIRKSFLKKKKICFAYWKTGYNPDAGTVLFQELLKFNFLTQKWSKVFSANTDKMPKESVSNALTLKDNCLVVSSTIFKQLMVDLRC